MSEVKPLNHSTVISDRDILRWDWDGMPRFYFVRIFPHESRDGYPRVHIHVQLESDPLSYSDDYCDDLAPDIFDTVMNCIGDIEELCSAQWNREANAELDDQRLIEERRL